MPSGVPRLSSSTPILPDDTAYEVFGKLTVAAEQTLWQALPSLMAGTTVFSANNVAAGSYFGGRKPEDGRINWHTEAQTVYNLHRALAPPYPGAWTERYGHIFTIKKARLSRAWSPTQLAQLPLGLSVVDNAVLGVCADSAQGAGVLHIHELLCDGQPIAPHDFALFLQSNSLIDT